MLWKKTSINYSKWNNYTSSSDEEKIEPEPIVPKNDPNFQALEKDMKDRNKKRQEGRKKAEELKQKGNEQMALKEYKKAV